MDGLEWSRQELKIGWIGVPGIRELQPINAC
jgi:hypothetical protein